MYITAHLIGSHHENSDIKRNMKSNWYILLQKFEKTNTIIYYILTTAAVVMIIRLFKYIVIFFSRKLFRVGFFQVSTSRELRDHSFSQLYLYDVLRIINNNNIIP